MRRIVRGSGCFSQIANLPPPKSGPPPPSFFPDGSGELRLLVSEHERISGMVGKMGGCLDLKNPDPMAMLKGMRGMMDDMDPNSRLRISWTVCVNFL